ncbi:uncharacterized protein [Pseudorasbora parva]|uniref:uncharacterized protein n=1 Tax=Pseudorasbora parva TaxID=51549 RepID=UPI00351E13FE
METRIFSTCLFTVSAFLLHGVFTADKERVSVSVMEGDSVTLKANVTTNQQEKIKWYFNNTLIAHINRSLSVICTDVQCKEDNVTERFRGRLKLIHQIGSLTIMNINRTHSGDYTLVIINGSDSETIFSVTVHGVFTADKERVSVSVMEGDSVTLNTNVTTNQQEKIKWYFNNTLIAHINRSLSMICTDVQCKEDNVTERFRGRLKLVHQTGSLTIMNINRTHSGDYTLVIINSSDSETIFSVTVHASERDECIPITEITGNQSKICTYDQCEEIFRDRLKLDHQTGSSEPLTLEFINYRYVATDSESSGASVAVFLILSGFH